MENQEESLQGIDHKQNYLSYFKIKKISKQNYFWTESSDSQFQPVYEYNEPQIQEQIQVEPSLEIPLPVFKKLEELEDQRPTALTKQQQNDTTQRINEIKQELSEQNDEIPSAQKVLIKNNQNFDLSFMETLVQKNQITELKCSFSNSNSLIFTKKLQNQDLSKRAEVLAKIFLKSWTKIQITDNNEQSNIIQNISEIKEKLNQDQNQPQLSNIQETSEQQLPESRSFELNDQTNELKQKINNLYLQLSLEIDKKIHELYQQGNLDGCIQWKQRKDDLEQDYKNIKDQSQLLQIMEVFKLHYNL